MASDADRMIEFDMRGQICPSTLLIALKEINGNFGEISSGTVRLVFRTDNRDCINTIPPAVENMGLTATVEKTGSGYSIVISK